MGINNRILDTINGVRHRPSMYMMCAQPPSLHELQLYVDAYLWGLGNAFDVNLPNDIRIWYGKKIGIRLNTVWTFSIAYYNKGETEEKLKEILLDTLEEFFRENPLWYQKPTDNQI